jgi:hypothetical protein
MPNWEYHKIDLGAHPDLVDDVELLNAAGEEGWEVAAITDHNVVYLKRRIDVGNASTERDRHIAPLARSRDR